MLSRYRLSSTDGAFLTPDISRVEPGEAAPGGTVTLAPSASRTVMDSLTLVSLNNSYSGSRKVNFVPLETLSWFLMKISVVPVPSGTLTDMEFLLQSVIDAVVSPKRTSASPGSSPNHNPFSSMTEPEAADLGTALLILAEHPDKSTTITIKRRLKTIPLRPINTSLFNQNPLKFCH